MHFFAQFIPLMAFLGLRNRWWAIIIIVVLVLLALAYLARGRTT